MKAVLCVIALLVAPGAGAAHGPRSAAAPAAPASPREPLPPDSARSLASSRAVHGFHQRLEAYAHLAKHLAKELPELPKRASQEQIDQHEQALADRLRAARPTARRGDMIDPATEEVLRGLACRPLGTADGAPERRTIGEDKPDFALGVNRDYPTGASLTSVPPSLLARLPRIPRDIEYRFVGRSLVLCDVRANLIIDYFDRCLPRGD
jgi:hypothetical protein